MGLHSKRISTLQNVRVFWYSHCPDERTGIGTVSKHLAQRLTSPNLSDSLRYYELDFKCPFCGITVIFPKMLRQNIEGEEEFVMRCPKCHEQVKLILKSERIETIEPEPWNPSKR